MLSDLIDAAGTIKGRVVNMQEAMKSIAVLTVNARIEVASLATSREEFLAFTSGIGHLLTVAHEILGNFDHDLLELRSHIQEANAGQHDFDSLRGEAIQSTLYRLSEAIGSLASYHAQVAMSASEVEGRSRHVGQSVASAIMALQIGDMTRQRVEHAGEALAAIAGEPRNTSGSRRIFITCRLQSAQLSAAARELDLAIDRILTAHATLARDARAIAQLGNTTSAVGQQLRPDGFMPELNQGVQAALDSLERYRRAKTGVGRLVDSVSDAVAGLDRHITAIQSLETDIRIMGLNTTFKCSRLGREGAALSAIAHEFRAFGYQTSGDAEEITVQLKTIVEIAASLRDTGTAPDATGLRDLMTGSVRELAEAGRTLEGATQLLRGDCGRVAALLEQTVPKIAFYREIVALLDKAAADLTGYGDAIHVEIDALLPDERTMLEAQARHYTMASERDVHNAILQSWNAGFVPPRPLAMSSPVASGVDEFLF